MNSGNVPAELLELRKKIDQIDKKLVELLASRFALTHKVGLLKANRGLDAFDAGRESQKFAELKTLCVDQDLNPDLINELFASIMEEVVRNHLDLREK